MRTENSLLQALVSGIVGSIIGSIPIVLGLSIFQVYSTLTHLIFLQDTILLRLLLNLVIALAYGIPVSIMLVFNMSRLNSSSIKSKIIYGIIWGLLTGLSALVMFSILQPSMFTTHAIEFISTVILIHLGYGITCFLIATRILKSFQSKEEIEDTFGVF